MSRGNKYALLKHDHAGLVLGEVAPDFGVRGDQDSSMSMFIDNDSTGTSAAARVYVSSGDAQVALFAGGSARTGTIVTSGPTGAQGTLRMLGAHPLVFGTSNTERLRITSNVEVQVMHGNSFRVYDSTDTDYGQLRHDGDDFLFNFVTTRDVEWVSYTGRFILKTSDEAESTLSFGTRGHIQSFYTTLNDDAETSFTLQDSYQLIIVNVRSSDEQENHIAFWSVTGAPVAVFAGTGVSTGAGVNPDIDGDINLWKSDNTTFHIKNRQGGSRGIAVWAFNPT